MYIYMNQQNIVIVTGMSGAGKSTVMKMMEDMGFFCIDNLPLLLLDKLVDLASGVQQADMEKVAIGIDVRNRQGLTQAKEILSQLKAKEATYEILFLDAENDVLVKRYKETRRSHPLTGPNRVDQGIVEERKQLKVLKSKADYIIDTSRMLTRELKA